MSPKINVGNEKATLPKNHPASREELFEFAQHYAVWDEERRKKMVIQKPTREDLTELITEYLGEKK